ncbi:MAG: bifunctional DNA-formamidopyrimidine glycosylase/DNA-(apurinic or apyrimidinic site) lyase [Gammaproteobacteria bacterium]|nr:bifunctional DNA-formamidopyrimidine glycosylase/DNA-(apurinic or apyrimidinic site) lyase [Gammaproteobacteria bacterium]
MPELPEVETVRRGLSARLLGHRLAAVSVRQPVLRWPVPVQLARRLRGRRLDSVERRGKYLLLDFAGARLLLHLGMSGRLSVLSRVAPPGPHDHVDFRFDDGRCLRFHDPRRFGCVLLLDGGGGHPLLDGLGPEPLSDAFTAVYLYARTRNRCAAIKSVLMDARVVAGVGNIYASESLHRAGVRPARAAGRLAPADCRRLVAAVRTVLSEAIAQGGTTLTDSAFAGTDGSFGDFQQQLAVYDREGKPCPRCGTAVRRVVIGQRSSYYCPRCQR